jgi:hypothetical protein
LIAAVSSAFGSGAALGGPRWARCSPPGRFWGLRLPDADIEQCCAQAVAYARLADRPLCCSRGPGGSEFDSAPATKYGRCSRLLAYAQAADQHVWSAACAFVGTVCGDLLGPCVCSMCRVTRQRAGRTLWFSDGDAGRAKRCVGMPCACLRSCPTQSSSRSPRLDRYFCGDDDREVERCVVEAVVAAECSASCSRR